MGQHRIEFAPLEETSSGVVLLQHVDVGPANDLASFLPKPKHPLERRQLAVNGRVRRCLLLPVSDVAEDTLCRQRLDSASREEISEVIDRVLDAVERLAAIRSVFVEEEACQIIEAGLVRIRQVHALAEGSLPLLQLLICNGPGGGSRRPLQEPSADPQLHGPRPAGLELARLLVAILLSEEGA